MDTQITFIVLFHAGFRYEALRSAVKAAGYQEVLLVYAGGVKRRAKAQGPKEHRFW